MLFFRKFWQDLKLSEINLFLNNAIETLQQLKTTFSALEKLIVIRNTYIKIENVSYLSIKIS